MGLTMKIKIINSLADKEDSSYSDIDHLIGNIYDVVSEDEEFYEINLSEKGEELYSIRKDEAEVVEDNGVYEIEV